MDDYIYELGKKEPVGVLTGGSCVDWATSGSPLPLDGKIPKLEKITKTKVRCWYCGGANRVDELRCVHCGGPLLEE
jgi:rRNA maturation endonuclease Nob1